MGAARAGQPGDALFVRAGIHLEKLRDPCDARGTVHRTFARLNLALNSFFREGAATGASARSAIREGQHLLNLVNPRVFPDIELLVGDREYDRENHAETTHQARGNQEFRDH